MTIEKAARPRILFCIPIFDDWASAAILLAGIADVASREAWAPEVLFVDDGSFEDWSETLTERPEGIARLDVLELRRNVGHQRAIAVGLAHVYENRPCDVVVVMDGDGEDVPASVPDLVARVPETRDRGIVFAKRARRSERIWFRVMYHSFKLFHWLFVGRRVEVGNFSAMSHSVLERLMGLPETGSHYAAAVEKSRIPVIKVPIPRGSRLSGYGKMNFVSLVTHGLSAMSVWGEEIGVRLLIGSALLVVGSVAGLGAIAWSGLGEAGQFPPWALTAAGLLGVVALNGLLLSVTFSFLVLRGRNDQAFMPLRDYAHYVRRSVPVGE